MADIVANGTIVALLHLRRSLFAHRGREEDGSVSVYPPPQRKRQGLAAAPAQLHALRVVGWGQTTRTIQHQRGKLVIADANDEEQAPRPYWIVANSWNRGWGDDGFGYIERGTNALGIESRMFSVDPVLI